MERFGGGAEVARPPFAESYPRDPVLDELLARFQRGDYAGMRKAAGEALTPNAPAEVREAVRDLLSRTQPDPLAHYLFAIAFGLLAFLAVWVYLHGHG